MDVKAGTKCRISMDKLGRRDAKIGAGAKRASRARVFQALHRRGVRICMRCIGSFAKQDTCLCMSWDSPLQQHLRTDLQQPGVPSWQDIHSMCCCYVHAMCCCLAQVYYLFCTQDRVPVGQWHYHSWCLPKTSELQTHSASDTNGAIPIKRYWNVCNRFQ